MGKDWAALGTLLDVFKIEDKKTVVWFLKAIDDRNSNSINEKVSDRQKTARNRAKMKK